MAVQYQIAFLFRVVRVSLRRSHAAEAPCFLHFAMSQAFAPSHFAIAKSMLVFNSTCKVAGDLLVEGYSSILGSSRGPAPGSRSRTRHFLPSCPQKSHRSSDGINSSGTVRVAMHARVTLLEEVPENAPKWVFNVARCRNGRVGYRHWDPHACQSPLYLKTAVASAGTTHINSLGVHNKMISPARKTSSASTSAAHDVEH